ncbi:MAG: methionyl-tRNA formyltransferase, partial [Deltaproteobacteria bacterium]|nr:methionyl-tRNA formyltransferase [Deltaproteobacteria bacterium]
AGYEVPLVVTRPDKPKGRGLEMSETPVKLAAVELGLAVFQPPGLKKPKNQQAIREAKPDLIVVAAYGRILPPAVLGIPSRLPHGQYGCINVHGSLLPKYRGAAPIQWAVINGEALSGVTIMAMNEGMDTGDILARAGTPIEPTDTAGTLFDRLAAMGADLLLKTLPRAMDGTLTPEPQDEALATMAPMMKKGDGAIDWTRSWRRVADLVRGTDPWPGAFTFTPQGLRLRIFPFLEKAVVGNGKPGEVLEIDGRGMVVGTGAGAVLVRELQPAGKRRMSPGELANGRKLAVGDVLGESR